VEAIQASNHPVSETFYWIAELRCRRYCLNNPHVCVGCAAAHNRKNLPVEHSPHVVDLAQRYTSPKTGKPVMVIASGRPSAFFPSTFLLKYTIQRRRPSRQITCSRLDVGSPRRMDGYAEGHFPPLRYC
jgi:hypothetical protein